MDFIPLLVSVILAIIIYPKYKRVHDEYAHLISECKKMEEAIKFYKERMSETDECSQSYRHYKAAYEHWTGKLIECKEKLKHPKFKLINFLDIIIFVLSFLSIPLMLLRLM